MKLYFQFKDWCMIYKKWKYYNIRFYQFQVIKQLIDKNNQIILKRNGNVVSRGWKDWYLGIFLYKDGVLLIKLYSDFL